MSTTSGWQPGDRVSLCPNGNESNRVSAIVVGVDEPGLPRGVRVRFDRLVNGVDNAYATHDELTLIERGHP